MVFINIKKGEESQFLISTTVTKNVGELVDALIDLYNDRLRLLRLADNCEELLKHGICKMPEMQGLTDEQISDLKLTDPWASKVVPQGGYRDCPDPIGRRHGDPPTEQMASVIQKTLDEARKVVSKDQIKNKVVLTKEMIATAFDHIKGALMIVYPMGLPPHETVRQSLENEEALEGSAASQQVFEHGKVSLWWAGKEMLPGKTLSEYIGRNEKTTIIAKLAKKGSGAPSREQPIDEQTQKEMMAFYYKKQEELKKLDLDDQDAYLDSQWADSGALKASLQGVGSIKMRPGAMF